MGNSTVLYLVFADSYGGAVHFAGLRTRPRERLTLRLFERIFRERQLVFFCGAHARQVHRKNGSM